MKQDLIKVKYEGNLLLTVDNQQVADNVVRCLLTFDCEISDVTLKSKKKERTAKKFKLNELEALSMEHVGMCFFFPKGTEIYVYGS